MEPIPLIAGDLGVDDITALSALPEPGTLLLLGTGLAMVIGVRRRRRMEGE